MTPEEKIAVVIPALNEAASIARVVDEARRYANREVVVVDDFSSDATSEIAKTSGATVMQLSSSLGAWGATQAGIRYALRKGHNIVVTMDADGQHPSEAIADLIEPIKRGEAQFTIGACPERGSSLRHVAWWVLKRLSGLQYADLTSGLRAYDYAAASLLASRQASFLDYQDVGVLVLLRRYGFVGREVPVTMLDRISGTSKIFSSWTKVIFYMAYSVLLAMSKRGSRQKPAEQLGSSA